MQVVKVVWRYHNDYSADLQCEHCGNIQRGGGLYADENYYFNVLPALYFCNKCGRNGHGQTAAEYTAACEAKAKAPALASLEEVQP